jgi:hypothetical protein
MKKSVLFALSVCLGLSLSAADAVAYTMVTNSQLQAVNSDGSNAWPGGVQPYPVSLIGVVVNNPSDMLDYGNSASSPQWQVLMEALPGGVYGGQTVAPSDYGGTALYMTKSVPWDPSQTYTIAQWTDEMNRLNYPLYNGVPVTTPLRYGDVIEVQANVAGLFYAGKFNINEQHSIDPANDFSITILQRGAAPAVASIQLSDLADAGNQPIFDRTRATGCERYQGSLVHLDGLTLVDPADWALGATVTVKQGGRTFPMQVGLDPALLSINPNTLFATPFAVTALVDQEDSSSPYTSGYSLWVTNAAELALDGDANRDGTVNGADLNVVLSDYNKTGMAWGDGDFNGDGTVNGADLNVVLSNYNRGLSATAAVPEPSTLLLVAVGVVGLLAYARRIMMNQKP